MLAFQILDVKGFMSLLLKNDLFDSFEVRSVKLQTFASFEIDGTLQKEFFSLQEQEQFNRGYCLWSELRPVVFQLIKGNKLPRSIKIIFSSSTEKTARISENASALFLNVVFENGEISCVTGSSQKNFTLEKSVDMLWDNAMVSFFKNKGIGVKTE